MSKFDNELLVNDEMTTICFNKKKYTKEEAFKEGKEELKSIFDFDIFTIRTGFVKHGFYKMDGEVFNGWNIDFMQKERKHKNDVEVWVVEGIYE